METIELWRRTSELRKAAWIDHPGIAAMLFAIEYAITNPEDAPCLLATLDAWATDYAAPRARERLRLGEPNGHR